MPNWQARQYRKDNVKIRASVPDVESGYCCVYGCGRLARAATSEGLDHRFCRRHADYYARHGSPYKGSYSAAVINPYRRAALDWLLANPDDVWGANAIVRAESLYNQAGTFLEAFRLRGFNPRQRATNAWARLRVNAVDPRLAVAAWLAVEMAIGEDRQPVTTLEFKRVQAAKIIHRLASGTHKRWPNSPGSPELHKYPASRGNVLRHIGADLEEAVELLVDHCLPAVHAFKLDRDAVGQASQRARPRGVSVRERYRAGYS
jgi:hypothetical protein